MPDFKVTITAHVTKTLTVTAPDRDAAIQMAHEDFTVESEEGQEERYEEGMDSCEEVSPQDSPSPMGG